METPSDNTAMTTAQTAVTLPAATSTDLPTPPVPITGRSHGAFPPGAPGVPGGHGLQDLVSCLSVRRDSSTDRPLFGLSMPGYPNT